MWFALPKNGEWSDLVSSLAGVGEITESKLLIILVCSNGAHRLFILHFCKFLILSNFRQWPKLLILPAAQIKTPARAMQALCVQAYQYGMCVRRRSGDIRGSCAIRIGE